MSESQEIEEVIRRWLDAWSQDAIDVFLDFYDSDAELITDPFWLDAGTFRGHDAIRGFYDRFRESFADGNRAVLVNLRAAGNTVVAEIDLQGRGRASGIDADVLITSVNEVERGKTRRQEWYFDLAEALKASGLPE